MKLDDLTYRINGCAMKVHNTLGNGFQEVIYQRCLAISKRYSIPNTLRHKIVKSSNLVNHDSDKKEEINTKIALS